MELVLEQQGSCRAEDVIMSYTHICSCDPNVCKEAAGQRAAGGKG